MNKNDFIKEVSDRCKVTKYVVEEIYNTSSNLIAEKLISGEFVDIPNMGKFILREKKATVYKNLFGGIEKKVDRCIYPIFQISSSLKNRIKNGLKYNKNT